MIIKHLLLLADCGLAVDVPQIVEQHDFLGDRGQIMSQSVECGVWVSMDKEMRMQLMRAIYAQEVHSMMLWQCMMISWH